MGKTLILIDGHALAFRQYFALEKTQMSTSDGVPTWAVYGFFKAIFDLLKNKDLKADAIAVAFDVSHVTFRTEKYSDYKSNREAMPDPMKIQMDLIYDGLKAFNIPIYTKSGFEADDVIGTISKRACELGHKVLILTGDQDAFQLVDRDGCVKVIIPSKGELTEYNWDKIYEKLGVYPNQVIDYKGLRGDTSDCIPGIKGIGEKTAQKLLARYGTLDAVLADRENIQEKSIREKICAGVEQAKLSQELATIIRDLDIKFDFESTKVELPDVSQVTEFLKKMQFYTFIKNINPIRLVQLMGILYKLYENNNIPTENDIFVSTLFYQLNKVKNFSFLESGFKNKLIPTNNKLGWYLIDKATHVKNEIKDWDKIFDLGIENLLEKEEGLGQAVDELLDNERYDDCYELIIDYYTNENLKKNENANNKQGTIDYFKQIVTRQLNKKEIGRAHV